MNPGELKEEGVRIGGFLSHGFMLACGALIGGYIVLNTPDWKERFSDWRNGKKYEAQYDRMPVEQAVRERGCATSREYKIIEQDSLPDNVLSLKILSPGKTTGDEGYNEEYADGEVIATKACSEKEVSEGQCPKVLEDFSVSTILNQPAGQIYRHHITMKRPANAHEHYKTQVVWQASFYPVCETKWPWPLSR